MVISEEPSTAEQEASSSSAADESKKDVFKELKAAQSMSTESIMRDFMLKQKQLKCMPLASSFMQF